MSFLSSIETAINTTANWFLKAFKKVQAAAPTVEQMADRIIPWAKLVIDGVLVAEGGTASVAEVNAIMDEINRELDVACAAIYDVGVTPTVSSVLVSTATNIDGLIEAGHVKNPANQALVKNVVSSLLSLTGLTTLPAKV